MTLPKLPTLCLALLSSAALACQPSPEAPPTTPQAATEAEAPAAQPQAPIQLPPDHPRLEDLNPTIPLAASADGPIPVEQDKQLPLPRRGIGSLSELHQRLEKLASPEDAKTLERAFRLVFTADKDKRDLEAARSTLTPFTEHDDPMARALAQRALGSIALNSGFDQKAAQNHYQKAIESDPDYGHAHYALVFLLASQDTELARTHFDAAMHLGIEDLNHLGPALAKP